MGPPFQQGNGTHVWGGKELMADTLEMNFLNSHFQERGETLVKRKSRL